MPFPFQLSQGALLQSPGHPSLGGASEEQTAGSNLSQLAVTACEPWKRLAGACMEQGRLAQELERVR